MKVLLPHYSILLSGHGMAFSEFTFSLSRLVLLFRFVCVCLGGGGWWARVLTNPRLYLYCTSSALAQ